MREYFQRMKTTQMNEYEDQMDLISQIYPGLYTQIAAQQEEPKPGRRRKKNKGGENSQCEGAKKRKLSQKQVDLLELNFGNEHKLESERKDRIASEVGLDPRQVAVWFQNRRARWKNKKMEEEYNKLKSLHEAALLDKCRLESEVLKLKEQLCEAEKGIQQLAERKDGVSSKKSSISSVLSMEANIDPVFQVGFGYDDAFYVGEDSYILGMELENLYM